MSNLPNSKPSIDLSGRTFGRWTVTDRPAVRKLKSGWAVECRCSCGNIRYVYQTSLLKGVSQSCGCLQKNVVSAIHGVHYLTKSPEYFSWGGAKQRCFNPNAPKFGSYGGRGITMCDRWANSFAAFYEDMGPKPTRGHSLDRIENDGNYEPGNCRWATRTEQQKNKRKKRSVLQKQLEESVRLATLAKSGGHSIQFIINDKGERTIQMRPRLPNPALKAHDSKSKNRG